MRLDLEESEGEEKLKLKAGVHSYPMPEVKREGWGELPTTKDVQTSLDAFLADVERQGGQVLGMINFVVEDPVPGMRSRGRGDEGTPKLFFVIKK